MGGGGILGEFSWGALFLGAGQFRKGQFSRGCIFTGGNCPRTNVSNLNVEVMENSLCSEK